MRKHEGVRTSRRGLIGGDVGRPVLTMSREKRARRIGTLYQMPTLQACAELLMDIEDDPAARALALAELQIMEREDG